MIFYSFFWKELGGLGTGRMFGYRLKMLALLCENGNGDFNGRATLYGFIFFSLHRVSLLGKFNLLVSIRYILRFVVIFGKKGNPGCCVSGDGDIFFFLA